MAEEPTHGESKNRIKELEKEILEKSRVEEILKKQKESLRMLLNASNDSAILVDTEGIILAINEVASQRLGKGRDRLVGTNLFRSIRPDVTSLSKVKWDEVVRKRGSVQFLDTYSGRVYENNLIPIFDLEEKIAAIAIYSRDVTVYKQTEEELRESEDLFKAIFNNAGIGIGITDKEGDLYMVNDRLAQLFGIGKDKILGVSPIDITHPGESKSSREGLRSLLQGEIDYYRFEKRYIREDGNTLWADLCVSPILDEKGDPEASIATIVDITVRKQTEEALKDEATRRRILIEQSRDGIVILDQDGKVYEANQRFADMLGYSADELQELHLWDWDTQWSREQLMGMVREVDETGDHFETRHRRKDGTYCDVEISTNGAVIGGRKLVFCVCRDITERKRAEEALKEAYNIINRSPAVAFLWNTTEGWPVEFVSENVRDLFGYTAEEFVSGKVTYVEIIHPDDWERVKKELERYIKERDRNEFKHSPYRILRRDGSVKWLDHMTFIRRDEKGDITHFQGLVLDISDRIRAEEERKRIETQLQQAQKMKTIGTLAGGVAHDLNNILSGIVSYPDLMLMDLPEDSPLKNPILTIKKSGERAAVIVEDLLTLARRGLAIDRVVNLNDIISEQLKSPEFEKLKVFHQSVEVKTNLDKDLLNIKGSSAHLSKVFMNLISNAAEAMPDGGKIVISTENRYIDRPVKGYDNVEEGDYAIIKVSDSGVGISKEDMDNIFEPFYTKKVIGRSGTGLGMAVVWGTIKDHNGYIDVESFEGRGTTITLYFPVTRERIITDESPLNIEEYMGKGESILVVDDVEEQREIASIILNRLGYSVKTVSSGEEAVDYLRNNHIDLLVLDMIMYPGIDGYETYRRIIKLRPEQRAVIASGFSETEQVKETQRLGGGQYIKCISSDQI